MPTNETNPKKSSTACPLVEIFLLAVYKRFAQDLIRQSCADLYFEPASSHPKALVDSSSSSNQQLSSQQQYYDTNRRLVNLGEVKFPARLNVKDVYRTIMRHDRFDFLTNKYMGVYVEENETLNNDRIGSKSATAAAAAVGQNGRLKKNFSDSSLVNNK